jgi:hypothetical protein
MNKKTEEPFIDFIKSELLNSNELQIEILKPIFIYYGIPIILLIILLNFIATMFAIYIMMKHII